jgi:hypothetical protein
MDKPRNGGTWTQARFNSFIKSLLRKGTQRWGPKNECLKQARVEKGVYYCQGCQQNVPVTVKVGNKRLRNVFVDHRDPIIDPEVGFTTWDDFIESTFCEADNLQVLCGPCHDKKTAEERKTSTERARQQKIKEKENNNGK